MCDVWFITWQTQLSYTSSCSRSVLYMYMYTVHAVHACISHVQYNNMNIMRAARYGLPGLAPERHACAISILNDELDHTAVYSCEDWRKPWALLVSVHWPESWEGRPRISGRQWRGSSSEEDQANRTGRRKLLKLPPQSLPLPTPMSASHQDTARSKELKRDQQLILA